MINRKRKRRVALVALLAFVLGTTAFAYAASITFQGSTAGHAGQGDGPISGYEVQNIHYDLDDNDPSNLTGVTFELSPATATTVKAKINGMLDWSTCTGGPTWTCALTGTAVSADTLEVAAAD